MREKVVVQIFCPREKENKYRLLKHLIETQIKEILGEVSVFCNNVLTNKVDENEEKPTLIYVSTDLLASTHLHLTDSFSIPKLIGRALTGKDKSESLPCPVLLNVDGRWFDNLE